MSEQGVLISPVDVGGDSVELESDDVVLAVLEWDLGDAPDEAKDYPVLLTTAYY